MSQSPLEALLSFSLWFLKVQCVSHLLLEMQPLFLRIAEASIRLKCQKAAKAQEGKAKAHKSKLKCSVLVQEAAEKPKINKLLAQWSTGCITVYLKAPQSLDNTPATG
jgi:hypothetical protein